MNELELFQIKQYFWNKEGFLMLFWKSFDGITCDTLRDFAPFVQFKNVKNTHGGVLLKPATLLLKPATLH